MPSGARRRRLSFVLLFLIPSKKCPKCDYPIISPCFLKLPAISNALYLLSNFNILSAVFCRTLCNRAVCPQPIKNIVTTPSFARTCESRITSLVFLWADGSIIDFHVIPREARPKASRSGVYNFVPQRAQAG